MTEFDYVVVGAGSAGSALAARLSEDGKHTVLLLEAGGSDRTFWIQMPIGYGKVFYDAAVNWNYVTEPDPNRDMRWRLSPAVTFAVRWTDRLNLAPLRSAIGRLFL